MKVDVHIPSQKELNKGYEALIWNTGQVDEKKWVAYSQLSRFDPRLFEILVQKAPELSQRFSPVVLLKALQKVPWPQAFLLILDLAAKSVSKKSLQYSSLKFLHHSLNWKFPRLPTQSIWIGQRSLKGVLVRGLPDRVFLKYGFWNEDSILETEARTFLKKNDRLKVLRDYLRSHSEISAPQYIKLLGGRVSQRQAQRDLASFEGIKPLGQTRGRRWRVI